MLCVAANTDTGAMWECPLLLELQELPDVLRPMGLGQRGASSMRSRSESFRSVSCEQHCQRTRHGVPCPVGQHVVMI
jgi:sucrose-6-phosphate hydrolase SacC (GH32 family)